MRINSLALRHSISLCPAFHQDIKSITGITELINTHYLVFLHDIYRKHFQTGITEGLFPVSLNYRFTLDFFDEQIMRVYTNPLSAETKQIETYAHTILTYLAGICTDKGREELKSFSPNLFYF